MALRTRLADAALRTLAAGEKTLDRLRYRGGLPDEVQVLLYAGYRSADRLFLSGRVIEGRRSVTRGDGTLSKLRTMLDVYESDEVPGVRVQVTYDGHARELTTDDEGYFTLEMKGLGKALPRETRWEEAKVRVIGTKTDREAYEVPVLAPGTAADLGLISDIDDTIIETGATNFLKNWRRVLAERPKDRLAVPGAPALYRMLAIHEGAPVNPVFYVSSSPWNLYGFLARFMELNDIPRGPMFLKDYGITENSLLGKGHVEHKTRAIEHLLSVYPDMRFLLIGDDGQKDPAVFAQVVADVPGRVAGVFVRDVHGDGREGANGHYLREIEAAGVPVYLGETMEGAKDAAAELGVIREAAEAETEGEAEEAAAKRRDLPA